MSLNIETKVAILANRCFPPLASTRAYMSLGRSQTLEGNGGRSGPGSLCALIVWLADNGSHIRAPCYFGRPPTFLNTKKISRSSLLKVLFPLLLNERHADALLLPRCYQDRTNHLHLLPFQEHPGLLVSCRVRLSVAGIAELRDSLT